MNELDQIAPHHQRAIERITGKFQADPQVVALLLAGSIISAHCLFTRDPEIETLVGRIPVYQRHEKADKILSFYAGLALRSGFFWGEAQKRNDPYLRTRMVSEVVLFGCRLILAHNERLFLCQKRLVEVTDTCPDKPAHFRALLDAFLAAPTDDNMRAFTKCITEFRDWGIGKDYSVPLTQYQHDHEQWWYLQRPYIAEW